MCHNYIISAVELIIEKQTKQKVNPETKTTAEACDITLQIPIHKLITLSSIIGSNNEIKNFITNEVASKKTPLPPTLSIIKITTSKPKEFLTSIADDNKTLSPPLKKLPTIGIIDPVVNFNILNDKPLYWELTTVWEVNKNVKTTDIIPKSHFTSDNSDLDKLLSLIVGEILLTNTDTDATSKIGIKKFEIIVEVIKVIDKLIGLNNVTPNPPENSLNVIITG